MSKKLYVAGLDWGLTDLELQDAFSVHGEVEDSFILKDREGRSRGFGFVTFADDGEGDAAIEKMNGTELKGRKIIVNEARPRRDDA